MNGKRTTVYAIIAVCIAGIAVVGFFIFKYAPVNESFSELYFENQEQLPNKIRVGEEQSFAFTVVSYEHNRISYSCVVKFGDKVIKEETFTLSPLQKRTVDVKFTPSKATLIIADGKTHVQETNFDLRSVIGTAWSEENTTEPFPWTFKPEDGTFTLPIRFRYDATTQLLVLLELSQSSKDSFIFRYVDKQDLKSNEKKIGYIIREEKQTIINDYGKITLIQENTDTEYRYEKKKISVEVSADGKEYEIHFWTIVEELAELKK